MHNGYSDLLLLGIKAAFLFGFDEDVGETVFGLKAGLEGNGDGFLFVGSKITQ